MARAEPAFRRDKRRLTEQRLYPRRILGIRDADNWTKRRLRTSKEAT